MINASKVDTIETTSLESGHYFCPPAWLGLIKQLVHLAQFSGGLQVLDGERGSGKTVMAQQLAQALGNDVSLGVLALPAGLPATQVFDCLLAALGINAGYALSVGQSIVALREFDASLKSEQLRKVLIIDDAHHFDDQVLAALASVFQGNNETEIGLSLIFIAEPGLAQRLDRLNLVDIEVRDSRIPKFSLKESKALVIAAFATAHPDLEFPLEDELMAAIWREGDGKPGDILQMAQAAWLEDDEAVPMWHKRVPVWHVFALVFLLLVLFLGYLSKSEEPQSSEDQLLDSQARPAEITVTRSTLPVIDDSHQPTYHFSSLSDAVQSSQVALTNEDLEAFAGASSVSNTVSQPLKKAPITLAPKVITSQRTTVMSAPQPTKQAVSPATAPQTSSVEISKPAKVPAAAEIAASPRPKPARKVPTSERLSEDERFLMARPKQGYVLQLLGASSRQSLENFVTQQPNRKNIRIYRALRSGKSWYVAVEGFYADKDSALAAMTNLPKEQLKAGPWAKPMAAVRLEITTFKQQAP
ncbi:SPOR domain-containing protein [Marinagarivorans algicola]|uniref:SPOR domain-containing protein n=1 Tax=Marinagarivorans algicola TaxID=1513270 RepID=UPI0006B9371F|nr:AAA family ATPase [Marinagarivorans algicola]